MKSSDLSVGAVIKKFWELIRCFIPMLILITIQVGSTNVCSIISTFIFSLDHPHATDAVLEHSLSLSNDSHYIMIIMLVYDVVGLLGFGFYYFMMLKTRPTHSYKNISIAGAAKIIVFFAALEVLVGAALNVGFIIAPGALEHYFELIDTMGLSEMSVLSTLVAIVLTPVLEEIAYRAVTINLAEKFTDEFWLANITQAAIFGLAHLNLVQGIYAFLMGLVLGYVYKKYKSLAASIIGHISFNIAGTFLVPFVFGTTENVDVSRLSIIIVVSLTVSVVGAILVKKDIPKGKQ